ncbi:uncharacterized protein [Aristolochia californica]|uniref:uncharacterized protein n=1 Tax=Aristolochia californica TaxID=171875 RepID=UPI0035D8FB68
MKGRGFSPEGETKGVVFGGCRKALFELGKVVVPSSEKLPRWFRCRRSYNGKGVLVGKLAGRGNEGRYAICEPLWDDLKLLKVLGAILEFLKGRGIWGHIDGSDLAPGDANALSKWIIMDARVMTWILASLEPHYRSIEEYFSGFQNLWVDYIDIVYEDVPTAALSVVQAVHDTSKRDQFLMKLRPEFEIAQSHLMNRHPVPSLDTCLSELLWEEQRFTTQAGMEPRAQADLSAPVAYVAPGRPKGRDTSSVQCFHCKAYSHFVRNCPKGSVLFYSYCKKPGHHITVCPTQPERRKPTTYHASTDTSSSATLPPAVSVPIIPVPPAPASSTILTPEMVQQMIISAFSTFGISGKQNLSTQPWYFDYSASNHMTNNVVCLSNVRKYDGNMHINTADGSTLPISVVGDLSPSLVDVFVSPDLSTNLLYVGQLVDKNCNIQFSRFGCVMQDQASGKRRVHVGRIPRISSKQRHYLSTFFSLDTQQNGVAKRKNRHLLDMVCTLLIESSVPPRFWCEALSTFVHLINPLPSPVLHHVSPFVKLFGYSLSYIDLRTFGCVCFVHLPDHERYKLTTQSVMCAFLGYGGSQKGYVCYDPQACRVLVSRNVVFFENQYFFPSEVTLPSTSFSSLPSFDEPQPTASLPSPPSDLALAPDPPSAPAPLNLHKSTCSSHPPDWYGFPSPASLVATLSSISIPSSHKQAIAHECWKKAMQN